MIKGSHHVKWHWHWHFILDGVNGRCSSKSYLMLTSIKCYNKTWYSVLLYTKEYEAKWKFVKWLHISICLSRILVKTHTADTGFFKHDPLCLVSPHTFNSQSLALLPIRYLPISENPSNFCSLHIFSTKYRNIIVSFLFVPGDLVVLYSVY